MDRSANAASLYFLTRNKTALSGVAQGLALAVVKVLAILSWPVFWLVAREKRKWLCASIVVSGAIYLFFISLHVDVLYPLKFEGQLASAGNFPYVLQPLLSMLGIPVRGIDIGTAAILVVTVFWLVRMCNTTRTERLGEFAIAALVLVQVVFMLVSKKSFPAYFAFAAFPAWLLLAARSHGAYWRMIFFSAFNLLLATESSLWFWLGGDNRTLSIWVGEASTRALMVFVAADLLLISSYLYFAYLSAKWISDLARGHDFRSETQAKRQFDLSIASQPGVSSEISR